jgi:DNA-binding NtrC family response regulator
MPADEQAPLLLIVDDEQHLCWVLSKVLSDAGYRVRTASQGREALRICAAEDVGVVILDYRLPDTNGIDLFQQLCSSRRSLVGLLITSYGSSQLQQAALDAGFLSYFNKPLIHQKLLECLASIATPSAIPDQPVNPCNSTSS